MLKDVTHAQALGGYRIKLRFEDGVEGVIDVAILVPLAGVFRPLRDPKQFAAVHVELSTICWPCGADLDPDVLYAQVTGKAMPAHEASVRADT